MVDVRSLDLSRTSITNGGFAGNGLEVVIPEGGFRGLGPLDRLAAGTDGSLVSLSHPVAELERGLRRQAPRAGRPLFVIGTGLHPTNRRHRPAGPLGACSAARGPRERPAGRIPIGTYLYHANQPGDCGDASLVAWGFTGARSLALHRGARQAERPFPQQWILPRLARREAQIQRAGHRIPVPRRSEHQDPPYVAQRLLRWRLAVLRIASRLVVDQVAVSTHGRIGCMDPFKDDNSSLFRPALTELHARGLLFGCGYRLACPDRTITRGEAAAFFHRVMGLPATSKDFFSDDGNSRFQNAINRLAAEGIVRGCAPRAFCPDRLLTRAEFAAMTVRAMGLPRNVPNAFADDNGHWAESAIDAFDAAGITRGCAPDSFCPNRRLTRGEASAFFVRVDDLMQPLGQASAPTPPSYPPPGDPPVKPPEEQD